MSPEVDPGEVNYGTESITHVDIMYRKYYTCGYYVQKVLHKWILCTAREGTVQT